MTFTPAPDVKTTMPTLTVRDIRLDGLSRERLLRETEKHVSTVLATSVTVTLEEEQHHDSVPVLVARDRHRVVALGSVELRRQEES